ncbi:DDE-type integrase/transposase/recombinase [Piscirickettsia salmonis]|uniref:DDE-type integrase/transposase/recombinase n=1 Tax=Piscirickettsia salmonis TaxID=1238 RepID=UPI0037534520
MLGDFASLDVQNTYRGSDAYGWGFDKMMAKIKQNYAWNHKRVYRVYCELKLNLRVKPRKRLSPRQAKMLVQPIVPNYCWSLDFMSDTLSNKRKFRTLNVIDDYNRECLLIEPAFSLPSMVVTRLLDQVAESKGYPEVIRSDNGPEFISSDFTKWAEQHNILLHHIQPGKPAQNGFIERFNRTYRQDILDAHWFYSLEEVREIRKRRYLGRYFAHPMMQNRRAKRDDYKPSAVRVTQRYVP